MAGNGTLRFFFTLPSGVTNPELHLSLDGGLNYVLVSSLNSSDSYYDWSVGNENSIFSKLKITAVSATGESLVATSDNFVIDSIAPAAPALVLDESSPTNKSLLTLTASSCSDRSHLYISENSTTPTPTASGWQSCSLSTGALSFTVSGGEGAKTLYFFAKDLAGNVSSSNSLVVTIDRTPPTAPAVVFASNGQTTIFKNVLSATFTAANCTDTASILITESSSQPQPDNLAWASCTTALGGLAHTLTSSTQGPHSLKVWAMDQAGNVSSTGTVLSHVYDTLPPSISVFHLAGGASIVSNPTVSVAISASDSSPITHMCLSEGSNCSDWVNYATSGTNFSLSQTSGQKTISLWLRDAAGNESTVPAQDQVTLEYGPPPTVAISSPAAGSYYAPGQQVPIAWTCATTTPTTLAPTPIAKIEYSTDDGATIVSTPITIDLANNDSQDTGHYDWTVPAGVTSFRILISCRSAAGVVSTAWSPMVHNRPWSIFMGDSFFGQTNVNVQTVNASWSNGYSSIVGDKFNNVFYIQNNALMKVDALSGQVTTILGTQGASNCTTSPTIPGGRNMSSSVILGMDSSNEGVLVFSAACGLILKVNGQTNAVTSWASVPNSSRNHFLTKNRTLVYFGNDGYLYKVNLMTPNQTASAIYGNGVVVGDSAGVITGRYALGTVVTGAQFMKLANSTNQYQRTDSFLMANSDASKIWLSSYLAGNGYRIDLNADGKYEVGVANLGATYALSQGCLQADFDSMVYCRYRWSSSNGRLIQKIDPETFTWLTSWTLPYDNDDDSVNLALGASPFKLLATMSFNGLFSISTSTTPWTSTRLGGEYLATLGNGTNPGLVNFDNPSDIKYSAAAQKLFVRNARSHVRVVDFGTSPYTTGTLYPTINNISNSNSQVFIPSLAGDRFMIEYQCLRRSLHTFSLSGDSLVSTTSYLNGGCTLTGLAYPPADGAIAQTGPTSTVFPSAFTQNSVPHSNGLGYFSAENNSSDVFIFKSDGANLYHVAGRLGAGGHDSTDDGNLALGSLLKRVHHMQELSAAHPTNPHDLLIWDGDRLRLITVGTEPLNPRIVDVFSFTIGSSYTAGVQPVDFVYDESSEQGGVLGTGKIYYVDGPRRVHKFVPNSTLTSATDSVYDFTGTSFAGGNFPPRITLTPAGLLVLQPTKQRILRVEP